MILRAGNVEVFYENGFLRYFKMKEVEVIRMIYFAIRDVNWGTYPPLLKNEYIQQSAHNFSIRYEAEYVTNDSAFMTWQVQITGDEAGKITFDITGNALHDFKTNRIGFCILHPIEHLTDSSVIITHSDGTIDATTFPRLIEPYQVFFEVQAIDWQVGTGVFRLQLEGAVFETEDQRNWGDTSFKTYSTPIALPFPRLIEANSQIHQRVVFEVLQTIQTSLSDESKSTEKQPFEIGICAAAKSFEITSTATERLKALSLDHYRVEVNFADGWHSLFDRQVNLATQLEIPLDLVFFLDDDYAPALNQFLSYMEHKHLVVKYLTLFSKHAWATTPVLIDAVEVFRAYFPTAKIGVGTNFNFTELNRDRLEPKSADFVCFSFHPQEHASDNLTLMENTETMKYQVASALAAFQRPVRIAPISLLKRNNPYATEASAKVVPYEHQIDARQQTTFLMNWTDAVLDSLISSGVQSITLYQTVGDLGIMDTVGNPYPVYDCFKTKRR